MSSATMQPEARRVTDVVLYAVFALTGICVAAPGALLPLFLSLWKMNDARGGILLFGFFVGSSLGGLSARGSVRLLLTASCSLAALSTMGLGVGRNWMPLACFTLFGFALGMCMTSISLQQSRAQSADRAAEMARLNLTWAAGALAGPTLCLRLATVLGAVAVFHLFSAVFLLAAVALLFLPRSGWKPAKSASPGHRTASFRSVLPLLVMIPLATGLESAAGGWLTTYASRGGSPMAGAIGLSSIFWGGLLLCRLAYSSRQMARHARLSLRWNPVLALLGVLLLWNGNAHLLTWAGAFCLGWGIGSLYPIALALLLDRNELGNIGFLMAGIGGASLPLLTGIISNAAHTLRAGIAFLSLPAMILVALGNISSHETAE